MSNKPTTTDNDLSNLFDLLVQKMREGLEANPNPALMSAVAKFLKDQEITCADTEELHELSAAMENVTEVEISKRFNE